MTQADSQKKIIGLGVACMDYLVLWQDVKAPVCENQVVGFDFQGGGMVATALVTVARLGGRAEFWGAVGKDWIGDLILDGLRREKVDTSQVRRVAGKRGPLMMVCVDRPTGERHFYRMTGLCEVTRPLGSPARLKGAGCLLVDELRPESDLRAAQAARRLGVPVVGDLAGIRAGGPALLAHLDYAIVSEDGARRLGRSADCRKACERIRSKGPRCVVITLGRRGLAFHDGKRFGRMKAFRVKVVDTTGAGDVFHGAFCWGLVEGLAFEENLAFASATAAMKCRRIGGRAGIPTRREVLRFLREHKADLG